jgi:HEAT repeat protein
VAFAVCLAAATAQEEVAKGLLDDDPAVRAAAAQEIGKLGPVAAPAVPQLIDLVYDEFDAPSKAAIHALGRIGPAARDARPFLVDRATLRGDFEPIVAQALARIGPPDPDSSARTPRCRPADRRSGRGRGAARAEHPRRTR